MPDQTKCRECGTTIDTSFDTIDRRNSCSNCGSYKRIYLGSANLMKPSNYFLDKYVACKLSKLNKLGAKELPDSVNLLTVFILNSMSRSYTLEKDRLYAFNYIRRVNGALSAYKQARQALIEYLESEPNVFSPYFIALLNFEVCISQCYQGYKLLANLIGSKEVYEKKEKSIFKKLNSLYIKSKHMAEMIYGDDFPTKASALIWITNEGLECRRAKLSFEELFELLVNMEKFARELSNYQTDDTPDKN